MWDDADRQCAFPVELCSMSDSLHVLVTTESRPWVAELETYNVIVKLECTVFSSAKLLQVWETPDGAVSDRRSENGTEGVVACLRSSFLVAADTGSYAVAEGLNLSCALSESETVAYGETETSPSAVYDTSWSKQYYKNAAAALRHPQDYHNQIQKPSCSESIDILRGGNEKDKPQAHTDASQPSEETIPVSLQENSSDVALSGNVLIHW